jgi:hypothetical protein
MLAFLFEWSSLFDGLPSNLMAELIGFSFSLVMTVFVVNKVVDHREAQRMVPLRLRLRKAAEESMEGQARALAHPLGVQDSSDAARLTDRVAAALPWLENTEELSEKAQEVSAVFSYEVAGEAVLRRIRDLSAVSDRLMPILVSDYRLSILLSDAEESMRLLGRVMQMIEVAKERGLERPILHIQVWQVSFQVYLKTFALCAYLSTDKRLTNISEGRT